MSHPPMAMRLHNVQMLCRLWPVSVLEPMSVCNVLVVCPVVVPVALQSFNSAAVSIESSYTSIL